MFGNCVHHIYLLTLWIITILLSARPVQSMRTFEAGGKGAGHSLSGASCIAQFVKHLPDLGSVPELGSSPGEGNGNPLQYHCLENPMARGAWHATVHGITRVGHDLVLSFFLSQPLKE